MEAPILLLEEIPQFEQIYGSPPFFLKEIPAPYKPACILRGRHRIFNCGNRDREVANSDDIAAQDFDKKKYAPGK